MTTTTTPTTSPIPMLKGMPVVGNLYDLRYDRLALLLRMSRELGEIGAFRVGPRMITLLNSSEFAYEVLVEHANDFEKTPNIRVLAYPLIGNGLLSSENEFHKRQRKLVAPAFQHRRVAAYADVMTAYAERVQSEWRDGQHIDVAHEMHRLTLGIVGKALFDADVLHEADELGNALTVSMHYFITEVARIVHIPLHWPTPRNRKTLRAIARLDATIYEMIEARRRSSEDRGDLLSMLLRARDEDDGSFMSDAQVRDEAMTLFLAGHETTANALAWTWYLLSQHPDIYDRLRDEVDGVLTGRLPTLSDLPNLPYTQQVLKEAIRLYPPAYVVGRQVVRNVELHGTQNYILPKESIVFISPYTMHRRADYFPDPERFDPERFTPEREQRLPRYGYIPFSSGPRNCIGNHFAMMEGHLLLATLAQRVIFEFVGTRRVVPEPLVTLRPKGGIPMVVHMR